MKSKPLQTIYFTKEMKTGTLKGLRFNETLTTSFPEKWAIGKVMKSCFGGGTYEIVDFSYQKYWRD